MFPFSPDTLKVTHQIWSSDVKVNVKVECPLRNQSYAFHLSITCQSLPVLDDKLEDLKAVKKKIVSVYFFTVHIHSFIFNN